VGKYEDCIEKFDEFVKANIKKLHNNLKHGIEEEFKVNYDVFRKKFKAYTDETIKSRFCDICLNLAKYYLKESEYTTLYIGLELGFTDEANFSNWFKKNTGYRPSDYKMSILHIQNEQDIFIDKFKSCK